jgi:serine/threonine-protein kinase
VAIVADGTFDSGTLWWVKPGAAPSLLLKHTVPVRGASVSPDGRWLAYGTSDTGGSEVYVRPLTGSGVAYPVSTGGGDYPRWSKQGTELLYFEGDRLMAVSVTSDNGAVRAGRPSQLFRGPYNVSSGVDAFYDVTPDGRQFILSRPDSGTTAVNPRRGEVVMATNWIAELRERVR